MQIKKGLDREKKIGLVVMLIWFLTGSLFIGFQITGHKASAIGGGFPNNGNTVTLTNANSTTTAVTNPAQFMITGYYLVVLATPLSPNAKVASIADSRSNTYVKAIQSNVHEDTEIWYANYTSTTQFTTDTTTVTWNTSSRAIVWVYVLTGIQAGSLQTVKTNGTTNTISFPSFTPNTDFSCATYAGISTANAGTTFGTMPNFWYGQNSRQNGGSTTFYSVQELNDGWFGHGATTASVTMSTTTTPQWDDVVACFPTGPATSTTTTTTTLSTTTTTNGMSGGIVQEGNTTTKSLPSGAAHTFLQRTFDYKPQTNNLLLAVTYDDGVACSNQVPTDNNGLTWHNLVDVDSAGVFPNVAIYGTNFTIASTTETVNASFIVTSGTCHAQMRIFELTGISTNWEADSQVRFNENTTLAAGFNPVTPPTNWFVLESTGYNIGDTSAHTWNTTVFSEYNLGLASMENRMNGTNIWAINAYYPMWNLGSTKASVTPNSATSSAWAEVLLEIPTQTNGIVTNTITTTTTTISTTPTTTTTTSTQTIPTTTTTTTTTLFSTTTTSTNTSVTTITGTVIPEPAGSTDFLILLLAIIIALIMFVIGIKVRHPLPTFIGAMVLLLMYLGLNSNPQIVYGSNIFPSPSWLNEVLILFTVIGFLFVIYQLFKMVRS